MLLIQILYLYLLALTLAFLEVQVEGPDGWAAKLPCWRPAGHKWYARIYTRVLGGKELTGYHAAVFSFSLLILHLPYAWGLPWSISAEFKTLSSFFLFVVVWDFLWFVINPHYGLKKFRPNCIAWHKRWLLGVPLDYWGAVALSFVFHLLYARSSALSVFLQWFIIAGMYVDLLVITMAASALIRRYWHSRNHAV